MKGRIIVIEGIDGSGKNTQANHILKYASKIGIKAEKISFPSYGDTFFGKEVGEYLNGKFGGLNDIHPKLVSLLYAGDRFEKKKYIQRKLESGYLLIIDRYVPSNVVHQAAKVNGEERENLANWIEELEYNVYEMPRPDQVLFLDVPPKTSQKLILNKDKRSYTDKKQDLHEESESYLESVYNYFLDISNRKKWLHVECYRNGEMRAESDILDEILQKIRPLLTSDT